MNKKMIAFRLYLCSFLSVVLFCLNALPNVYAVEESEKEPSFNSVVEVESYKVDEGYIEAGKDANITLTLHNSNKTSAANNLLIRFSSSSGLIYPAYGNDNQVFVGLLRAGESTTVSFPITVNADFTSDYADFTCDLIYESGGSRITNSVAMILPSVNVSEITVKSVEVSAHAIKNGKSLLSIAYGNNSKNNLNDAEIIIDGNVSESTRIIKLDTLIAGKTYTKDFNIVFNQSGEQSIMITLKYISSDGQDTKLDLGTYTVNVEDESASELVTESENSVLDVLGKLIALVAFIGAIVMALMYLKKR